MENCNQEEVWEYRSFRDEEGTYWVVAVQLQDGKIIEVADDCCPLGDTLKELEVDLQEMLHGIKNYPVLAPQDLSHLDADHSIFRANNVARGSCES